jgi:hypothetical protein
MTNQLSVRGGIAPSDDVSKDVSPFHLQASAFGVHPRRRAAKVSLALVYSNG